MKTVHNNIVDQSGRIYCYKHDKIASLTSDFIKEYCMNCEYFVSDIFNTGVACNFDDGCNEKEIYFEDAGESELHSKMDLVRLGLKTKEEVLAGLKSFNDYSESVEIEKESDTENPPSPEKSEEEK